MAIDELELGHRPWLRVEKVGVTGDEVAEPIEDSLERPWAK